MDCRELKAMIDSYISDELLVETNHEVLRHLESCADCRYEMSSRRALKAQLRHAVKNSAEVQIDPVYYSRMAAELKETAMNPGWIEKLTGGFHVPARMVAVGFACLLLAVTGTMVWMNRTNVFVTLNNNTDIVKAVRASWAELTSLAVGDHENCAVKYNLKEDPITLDEAATKFGAYNKDLDNVMMAGFKGTANAEVSGDVEFIESHSCVYEGRRFAHVVVKHKGKMVSILMTDTDLPGDSYGIQTALYDGAVGAAGFLAGHHAVFIVSQLAESDNVVLANAIAPAIRSHVEKPTM
ncbi:MAG TPA: zf-HC2 domain-containing protein [Pyrinomonadaceae bacterium]|nr:zf-HC2 domain-containing protein [Acidobacteriota bacterium]HQZ94673.1 zf-HC2 domain-containing protein [Pyrinomonadaceae bacterium]